MRRFGGACIDWAASSITCSRQGVIIFGVSRPEILKPPPASPLTLPNMWILDSTAASFGFSIRPLAAHKAVTCTFLKMVELYNMDQLSNPPTLPPASVHHSFQTQRPYGHDFQELLGVVASNYNYFSRWWITPSTMLSLKLVVKSRQQRHALTVDSTGRFYHISQLVDPEQLRTRPIAGKSGMPLNASSTDLRPSNCADLIRMQLERGFSTGLFFTASGLRTLNLKVKQGEIGYLPPIADTAGSKSIDLSALQLAQTSTVAPDAASHVSRDPRFGTASQPRHWYNAEDVLFPPSFEYPLVEEAYLSNVAVNGATGKPIDERDSFSYAPNRSSQIWFDAKYLLSIGAKIKVNCVPFVQYVQVHARAELFNADQLELPDAGFRFCGTAHNATSRLRLKAINMRAAQKKMNIVVDSRGSVVQSPAQCAAIPIQPLPDNAAAVEELFF